MRGVDMVGSVAGALVIAGLDRQSSASHIHFRGSMGYAGKPRMRDLDDCPPTPTPSDNPSTSAIDPVTSAEESDS